MTKQQLNISAWERITDEGNPIIQWIQQVGDSPVFKFVEVIHQPGEKRYVYHNGLVDVDEIDFSVIVDYHEGCVILGENIYKGMMEYIMDYYGGEAFDRQPFYFNEWSNHDMLTLHFLLSTKGIKHKF